MDGPEKSDVYWKMYVLMREELYLARQNLLKIEVFTTAGVAAVYSYLFGTASQSDPIANLAWFIVPVLVFVAWIPSYNIIHVQRMKILYLREEIEPKLFKSTDIEGWEKFYRRHPFKGVPGWWVYWPVIFVLSLGLAIFESF